MRRLAATAAALAVVPAAFAASAPAALAAERFVPEPPPAGATKRISDERTFTVFANVAEARSIYARPRPSARRIGRLRYWTEDRFAEVYLVLALRTGLNGLEWAKVRIPGRPNGRVGWVRREGLSALQATRLALVVNRRKRKITLYRRGRVRGRWPVGIGKRGTPTPAGRYWIRERIKVRSRSSPYWPYALGTSAYSRLSEWPGGGVVGIHGDWNKPWLIPGRPSHGCIRMLNRDMTTLARRIDVGAPLRII